METPATTITVETNVNVPLQKAWEYWNEPKHIINWCYASDDWHVPHAENDLRKDGKLKTTMAAKDGSFSFDFEGIYTSVVEHKLIEYKLADERKVSIIFKGSDKQTSITETFDAEQQNPAEMQKSGWQAILNNFKKYVESH